MALSVPYQQNFENFPVPSKIQIAGAINEGAKRIEINLHGSNGEFLLHFNPRFDEGVVVRNNTKDGQQWQKEERDGGLPFHPGQGFTLELDIESDGRVVAIINTQHFCEFSARDDLHQVSSLEIKGDLQLDSVELSAVSSEPPVVLPAEEPSAPEQHGGPEEPTGPQQPIVFPPEQPDGDRGPREAPEPHSQPEPEPEHPQEPTPHEPPRQPEPEPHQPPSGVPHLPLPYVAPLEDFLHTRRLRIVGTPTQGAQRFIVNFLSANGEVLFHFNPRLDQNCIVRNATKNRQWQYEREERDGHGCPFQHGSGFALDFIQDGPFFRCFVDGVEHCRFEAREDLGQLSKLEITGDILLHEVIIA
uniref:Galectin n=1 Tax=Acrobeloides nanus TaxID=290746 RepID=A0A914C2N5_9BILA